MKITRQIPIAILAFVLSCGDNNKGQPIDAAPDADETVAGDGFHQIEMLARPGINEALIISQDFLNAYNATAPTFAGVPESALNQVVAEAKTVLKALYLGGCLLNGVLGLSPSTGVKPGGITCHAVGGALFTDAGGATLTDASKTASQAYADKVFGQFIPDVMRIDTDVTSFYETPCGDLTSAPVLCGGRWLTDDTIDITYDYLLNGIGTASNPPAYNQVSALTSDGVNFSTTSLAANGKGTRIPFTDTSGNRQQGHPSVSNMFPYSAPPL
jgi:hypothetical protein